MGSRNHTPQALRYCICIGWLKCHEPAAFLCAMLNSQPMGFYSASQLIQDARRHGVQIRPVDVTISDRECTLEEADTSNQSMEFEPMESEQRIQPIVRLGLNRIKGMGREAAKRIVEARNLAPFENTDDLANRASLNAAEIRALASSDALNTLQATAARAYGRLPTVQQHDLMRHAPVKETLPVIPAAPEGKEILGGLP